MDEIDELVRDENVRELGSLLRIARARAEQKEARIEALEKALQLCADQLDILERAGKYRALSASSALPVALAALAKAPNDEVCGACGCIIAGPHDCQHVD